MLKTKNGITLIALVITIIVLLILAGVSISAITGDTGIVQKAKDAAKKTESAAEEESGMIDQYEQYIASSVNSNNGDVDEKLKRYILGEEGNGISIEEIIDTDGSKMKFIDNDIMPTASKDITLVSVFGLHLEDYNYIDIKFKDDIYRVEINFENLETTGLTKYEKKEVFLGNKEITEENLIVNLDIDELMVPWKKYLFDFTINGEQAFVTTIPAYQGTVPTLYGIDTYINMILVDLSLTYDEPTIYFIEDFCVENSVVLNGIYELGKSYYCVEEEGNIMLYLPETKWVLHSIADDSGIIPKSVNGINVEAIFVDGGMCEKIIIDRPIKLLEGGDVINVDEIKIMTNDLTFLEESFSEEEIGLCEIVIDLTECGDDIVIPENIIESYEYFIANNIDLLSGKIYVTEKAKERYQEYDFVDVR